MSEMVSIDAGVFDRLIAAKLKLSLCCGLVALATTPTLTSVLILFAGISNNPTLNWSIVVAGAALWLFAVVMTCRYHRRAKELSRLLVIS